MDATFSFENDLSAGAGRVIIRDLQWGSAMASRELIGTLVLRDGQLELTDVGGTLAGGIVRARGRLNVTEPERNFFSLVLDGADAKQLFAPIPEISSVLEGRVTIVLRARLGRAMRGSGSLALPRGMASGVPVTDLRIPFEWATAPGGYGRVSVHEAVARAGSGRVRANVTVEWGVEGA